VESFGRFAELEDPVELVGVAIGLGESNLAGADVEGRALSVARGLDFDEAVPPAFFVGADVVTEMVPDRLGHLFDISGQMILAGTLKPGSLVDHDQGLARIPEGFFRGFLLDVVERLRAAAR